MNSGGDVLARGGVRAQFTTADVSEDKWKDIFGEEGLRKLNLMDEKEREALKQQALPLVTPTEEQSVDSYDLVPVQDRLLVRRVEIEQKSSGGLFLADETKEKPYEGDVVAAGPGKRTEAGLLIKPTISVGDRVVFGKFSGAEVKVGVETLLVLREEDIFYVKKKRQVGTSTLQT